MRFVLFIWGGGTGTESLRGKGGQCVYSCGFASPVHITGLDISDVSARSIVIQHLLGYGLGIPCLYCLSGRIWIKRNGIIQESSPVCIKLKLILRETSSYVIMG